MRFRLFINGLICLGLTACGAGYTSRASDPAYYFGSEMASEADPILIGSNGLIFADGTQLLSDVEGEVISVKLARFVRDPTTGEPIIVLTDETAALPSGFTKHENEDLVITYDGQLLTFVNGVTTLESGQTIWSYMNYALENSGTGSVYTYAKYDEDFGADGIDSEGFFSIGFQTDPGDILSADGGAIYRGSYFGFGQVFDANGDLIDDEMRTIGAITMEADFSAMQISGQLNGVFDPDEAEELYAMVFLNVPITGNGFSAAPDMICTGGSSCTSATSLGGVFYGDQAAEISGVIGFDETVKEPGAGGATRFVGAAGFSSEIDLD